MADFQSLLGKAVANLPNRGNPALRQAIYERARIALVAQLRRMNPPLSETDIAREENALQAAAQRLEAEIVAGVQADTPPLAAPAAPARATSPPPNGSSPSSTAAPSPKLRPKAPKIPDPPQKMTAAPAVAPPPVAPPPKSADPLPRAPMPRVETKPVAGPGAVRNVAPPAPRGPGANLTRSTAPAVAAPVREEAEEQAPRRTPMDSRPAAPSSADEPRRRNLWPLAGLALGSLVIAGIATLAWVTRERPQDLAVKESVDASDQSTAASPNKIAERVKAANVASPAPASSAIAQPSVAPSPSPAQTAALTTPTTPAAPAAARAAMLVEVRGDPQKPLIAIGSVVWSLVPPTGGQTATTAVKADVDVPDLKLHATMTIKKNTDPALPATHTIDFKMQFADGAELKGAKEVGLLQLRRDDAAPEESVTGAHVKINDGYFLIGLTQSSSDASRNVDLIATHNWFDFPIVLNDDRVAKLAFEKAGDGDKIMAQALTAWK